MTNKEVIKKSLKWSLVFYVVAIIISILLREFSPLSFWFHNPIREYNSFTRLIFPFTFLIIGFFSLLLMPFSPNFYSENYLEMGGILFFVFISMLTNIFLYFVIFIFVYSYFINKYSVKINLFSRIVLFIKKYWIVIFILGIICSWLSYKYLSFKHSQPYTSFKEYRVCEKSPKIKSDFGILITEKGVCFYKEICDQLGGVINCDKNKNDRGYSNNWRVVKNLNKNNFDIKFITAYKKERDSMKRLSVDNMDQVYRLSKYNYVTGSKTHRIDENSPLFYEAKAHGSLLVFNNKDVIILINKKVYGHIKNVDIETFQYLGGKYSKDKNNVYYKNEIIGADPETFIYEKGKGKTIGKGRDKNGTWIKGILQDK